MVRVGSLMLALALTLLGAASVSSRSLPAAGGPSAVPWAAAPVPGPEAAPLDLNPFPEVGDAPYETRGFDLEAHRGGRALHTEESLAGYAAALELGVSTLELDIVITKDNQTLIWHDPLILATKCRDTEPATPDDPLFPYVGKYVIELTYAQIETLDCGFQQLPGYPRQDVIWGNKIAVLPQLFELVEAYGADDVWFNIETKVEGEQRNNSATPEVFVDLILDEVRAYDLVDRVYIQSFDWRSFRFVREREPSIPLVALSDRTTTQVGVPGPSPWLGGLDIDDFGGDLVLAVKAIGADIISPDYVGSDDEDVDRVGESGFKLFADAEFVSRAHEHGLLVVPWTIDDPGTIALQIEQGVDGIISDDPDYLREILKDLGVAVPRGYPRPAGFNISSITDQYW